MDKRTKIECLVKGKILKLTPEAFKMAEEYFGAERLDAIGLTKPIELSKPLLIPKKPVLSQPIQIPIGQLIKQKTEEVIAETVVEPVVNTVAKRKPAKKRK